MAFLISKAQERDDADDGSVKTRRAFSFEGHRDERWAGLKSLRAIHETRIQGGRGLGEHCHQEWEILTYVAEGTLCHVDSIGNVTVLRAGEAQCVTSGTGMVHAEMNASSFEECRIYQLWMAPERAGLPPSYEQKPFRGHLEQLHKVLVASRDGHFGSLKIHQHAEIWLQHLKVGESTTVPMASRHGIWVQVIAGSAKLQDGRVVEAGDGVASYEDLNFKAEADLELLEIAV